MNVKRRVDMRTEVGRTFTKKTGLVRDEEEDGPTTVRKKPFVKGLSPN